MVKRTTKSTPHKTTTRKPKSDSDDMRRDIVMKAVADPAFRRKLFRSPESIFGRKLNKADQQALQRMKKTLPALDDIITSLSGEILCGGGGGCPNLA